MSGICTRARGRLLGFLSALVLTMPLMLPGCAEEAETPTPTPRPTVISVRLPIVTPRDTATPVPATPWPTPTPAPTPTPIIHTIVAGDNLWELSREYGVNVSVLQEVNAILDPRRLQLGQEIVIPRPQPKDEQGIPTPTPLPYTIQGLTFQKTSAGALWCLGEVWNTTESTLEEVQVRVTLYDEAGDAVAVEDGLPSLDSIPPDQRVPFALLFRDPPRGFAHYEAQPSRGVAALPGGDRYDQLIITEDTGQMQSGSFVVAGQVRNTGSMAAEVRVAATIYDAEGNVIGLRSNVLPDPLAAEAHSPFTITLLSVAQPVSSYAVQAQGIEAG